MIIPSLGGEAGVVIEISISSNDTGVNLRTLFDAAGYGGEASAKLTVTVEAGVVIGSTTTTAPAMTVGSYGDGTILTLINLGTIAGAGGAGGHGANVISDGEDGGDAISIDSDVTFYIYNEDGIIQGGGGGGGGGVTVTA